MNFSVKKWTVSVLSFAGQWAKLRILYRLQYNKEKTNFHKCFTDVINYITVGYNYFL